MNRGGEEQAMNHGGESGGLRVMEVCGTHTAAIARSGLRETLPERVRLVSGPGCPVCVTTAGYIDEAIRLAGEKNILCFGDLMRVKGSAASLEESRNVRVILSPLDAIGIAMGEPEKEWVVLAVGFETTIPAYALLLDGLIKRGIKNVSLLTSLKLTIPAVEHILREEENIDGFLAPGHVAAIIGGAPFRKLAEEYGKAFVVAGFSQAAVRDGLKTLIANAGKGFFENQYKEVVSERGNEMAAEIMEKYFERGAEEWRGVGEIAGSGLRLKKEFAEFAALQRGLPGTPPPLPRGGKPPQAAGGMLCGDSFVGEEICRCGDVLFGRILPEECAAFGSLCSPENPIGPCMVSLEGACKAQYGQRRKQ
jgi:hydrogenase expression/formation protein HypD